MKRSIRLKRTVTQDYDRKNVSGPVLKLLHAVHLEGQRSYVLGEAQRRVLRWAFKRLRVPETFCYLH
jgi:hypothetical protein